jgi:DNA-binding transcriptional LysR family regulator
LRETRGTSPGARLLNPRGSQAAAARRLGRSPQAVNRSLAALEQSVGVELVRRTTRKSFATEPA